MTDAVSSTDDLLELDVGPVAHGGWCVARHDGQVVFVRHALPGERVRARVTEDGRPRPSAGAISQGHQEPPGLRTPRPRRFLRADAVEILEASPDRVEPPCPFAGPGRCGGCDWQHVALPAQRRLKAAVVEEQLRRLAGIERSVIVEEVPMPRGHGNDGEPMRVRPGLGWRTRVRFTVRGDGAVGFRRHRSHEIEPVDECLIAHPGIELMGIERRRWPGMSGVEGIASAATGDRLVVVTERRGRDRRPARVPRLEVPVRLVRGRPEAGRSLPYVREQAAGRLWQVSGSGFWQVHPGAAQTLGDAVLVALEPKPGDIAVDLYCGVGLFAGLLAERVGPDGLVVGVESDAQAVRDARFNLRDLPQVSIERGRVEEVLGEIEFGRRETARSGRGRSPARAVRSRLGQADLVVLDPPRAGAGREVVDRVAALAGRKIAYVSCDPATLARDLAYFGERGWTLQRIRAFDAFPMTHHVELLATLVRG